MPGPFDFPSDFRALERKYKGKTTRPVDQSTLRVKVKPTARKQPEIKTVPEPSLGGTARTIMGIAQAAPSALADLAVSVPKAAYNYVRTSTPGEVVADVKRGAGNLIDYVTENPADAFVETVAGTPKAVGEMLREATLARDAGNVARAEQIEKFAVPMLLSAIIPGGRAAKGARGAAKIERSAVESALGDIGEAEARSTLRVRPAATAKPEPRIEPRKKEAPKVEKLEVELAPRKSAEPRDVSIYDLEGKPFITSMSDLSAAGDDIVGINDVPLREPMRRMGGQDYMFNNPGSVWASDLGPAGQHLDLARRLKAATGEDPVFLPWSMGPTSIDFSHMPRELMLRYAADAMNAKERRGLSKDIQAVLPDFKSVEDPTSIEVFREATGKSRGALNRLLDQYRDRGGIGIGEARWATTDLPQVGSQLTSLRNVGTIDSAAGLEPSVHPSYRTSIPGEGVGRLREPVGALELLPDLMREAELSDPFGFPVGVVPGVKSPLRSLQMGPKGGVITEEMLRAIEARLAALKNKP